MNHRIFTSFFSTMEKNCQKDVSPQIVKRKKDNRRWCYRLKSVAYIRCFEKSTHSEKVLQLATKTFIIWKHTGKIMFLQLQEESRTIIIRIPITTLKDNCFRPPLPSDGNFPNSSKSVKFLTTETFRNWSFSDDFLLIVSSRALPNWKERKLSITNVFSKFQNSYFSLKNFKEINFSSWKDSSQWSISREVGLMWTLLLHFRSRAVAPGLLPCASPLVYSKCVRSVSLSYLRAAVVGDNARHTTRGSSPIHFGA